MGWISTPTAGIVLAAGRSSRMGQNKLLLPWGTGTVLSRVVRVALEAGLDPVVVVVGRDAEVVTTLLGGLPVLCVPNPDPDRGMGSSRAIGLQAALERSPDLEAAVVLLADMPLVTPQMVRTLLEARGEASIATSRYGEVVAPPVVYGRAAFDAMRAGQRGKDLVAGPPASAEVLWPTELLVDLDVPGDLERARREARRAP